MNKTSIELKDLAFYAYHGALPQEADLGQRFKVDVHLRLIDGLDFSADRPECTVNYVEIYEVVREAFLVKRYQLIEAAAESIAVALLGHFSRVQEVTIKVKKPSVPVDSICEHFAVEVNRCR